MPPGRECGDEYHKRNARNYRETSRRSIADWSQGSRRAGAASAGALRVGCSRSFLPSVERWRTRGPKGRVHGVVRPPGRRRSSPRGRSYERLDRYVIGQDAAKRAVAIAAYNHLKRIQARRLRPRLADQEVQHPAHRAHRAAARRTSRATWRRSSRVPFTTVDATEYTEAGYYGKDVEVMVAELLFKANHSVEDTQRGHHLHRRGGQDRPAHRRARATARAAATSAARACSRRCSSCSRGARCSSR